jgi:hypothetical protein
MDTIAHMYEVFGARPDTYAAGRPRPTDTSKYAYFRKDEPFTPEVLESHLRGLEQVAVYPIHDNRVRWAAFDFDAPKALKGTPDAFDAAWQEAGMQLDVLEAHGLTGYLERSRSGTGVHLWIFFDEWLDAGMVRRALLPLVRASLTYDRIYPTQSELAAGDYGNALALPYNKIAYNQQNAVFLDRETLEVIKLPEFLAQLETVSGQLLEELARKAPPAQSPTRRELPVLEEGAAGTFEATLDGRPATPLVGWLKVQSPYGCGIMRWAYENRRTLSEPMWYAVIQQTTCFEQGRKLAHLLSRDYPSYNPEEVDAKFQHALENPPMGCAALHEAFPDLKCSGCPRTAPYHLARRSLVDTVHSNEGAVIRGGFTDYKHVLRENAEGRGNPGIKLGHAALDQVTRYRNAELSVIGAMPNMGKTAYMVDSAIRTAAQGVPTWVFSNETGEVGLRNRFIANIAGIDSRLLRGEVLDPVTGAPVRLLPEEWERVEEALRILDELPLFLDFVSMQPDQMLRSIERGLIKYGIGFDQPYISFHDYIQFTGAMDGETLEQRTARVSQELKAITKITERPFVTFSQLVRTAEGSATPQLNWFRGSGRIEHDADVAYILAGPRDSGLLVPRHLWLLKQREGDVGVRVDFEFEKPYSRWTQVPHVAKGVQPCLLD